MSSTQNTQKENNQYAVVYNRASNLCFVDYNYKIINQNESLLTAVIGLFSDKLLAEQARNQCNEPKSIKKIKKLFGLEKRIDYLLKLKTVTEFDIHHAYKNIRHHSFFSQNTPLPMKQDNFIPSRFTATASKSVSEDIHPLQILSEIKPGVINTEDYDELAIADMHFDGDIAAVEITIDGKETYIEGNISNINIFKKK
jgi:hypothetical protein